MTTALPASSPARARTLSSVSEVQTTRRQGGSRRAWPGDSSLSSVSLASSRPHLAYLRTSHGTSSISPVSRSTQVARHGRPICCEDVG